MIHTPILGRSRVSESAGGWLFRSVDYTSLGLILLGAEQGGQWVIERIFNVKVPLPTLPWQGWGAALAVGYTLSFFGDKGPKLWRRLTGRFRDVLAAVERQTDLRLQFGAINTMPVEVGKHNIWRWYALRTAVQVRDENGNTKEIGSWSVFVVFDLPITFHQICIDSGGAVIPPHEVKDSSQRTVVMVFLGEMSGVVVHIYAV